MSRSRPVQHTPVKRYFKWSGGADKGYVSYWDKNAGESGEEIKVEFPFSFLPLNELHTVAGFHSDDSSTIWSNEVQKLDERMYIRTAKGVKLSGLYDDIKDQLKAMGGKYAKAIYIAYHDEDKELVIGKLLVTGASLTSWINFAKTCDPFKYQVNLTEAKAAKKGATKYFTPVFEKVEPTDEDNLAATKLDEELWSYLETRQVKRDDSSDEAAPQSRNADGEVVIDEAGGDPIDLSEIPF